MYSVEQWKVVSGRYRRVYDTKKAAKIDYGQWCKSIDKEEQGLAELFYRSDLQEPWILVEEFGYDEEEEDEDEEQDEDQDEDEDEEQEEDEN